MMCYSNNTILNGKDLVTCAKEWFIV